MRKVMLAVVAGLVLAACDGSPTALREESRPSYAVTQGLGTVCFGQVVAGISSTWPWAHFHDATFAPPKGSIALWIQLFGPSVGISSVRELQLLFCVP
jgi:hypothetical protein